MLANVGLMNSYNTLRLLLTGLITTMGTRAYLDGAKMPDPIVRALRLLISTYIVLDTFANKLTPGTALHHAIILTSSVSCFEAVSGQDYVAVCNMLPDSCVCEGTALLACIDRATKKRFKGYINALHILNFVFLRRRMWTTVRDDKNKDVRSERMRMVIRVICNALLCLDAYWGYLCIMSFFRSVNRYFSSHLLNLGGLLRTSKYHRAFFKG